MSSCKNEFKHEGYNTICYDIEKDYEAVSKELKASRAFGNSPFNVLMKRNCWQIRTADEAEAYLKVITDGSDGVIVNSFSFSMDKISEEELKAIANFEHLIERAGTRMSTFSRLRLEPDLNERVLYIETDVQIKEMERLLNTLTKGSPNMIVNGPIAMAMATHCRM